MQRREYLFATVAASVPLAGCSGDDGGGSDEDDGGDPSSSTGTDENGEEGGIVWEGWNVPNQVQSGETFDLGATISNQGSDSRTVEIAVYIRFNGQNELEVGDPQPLELEGNETREVGGDVTLQYVGTTRYRYEVTGLDTDPTVSIEVVPAQLDVGGTYTNPDDVSLSVEAIDRSTEYNYQNNRGETGTEQAPTGQAYIWVTFQASNQSGQSQFVPRDSDIAVLHDGRQYDATHIRREQGKYEGGDLEPDVTREGWIVYQVPEEIAPEDVTVAHSGDDAYGEWQVRWSG